MANSVASAPSRRLRRGLTLAAAIAVGVSVAQSPVALAAGTQELRPVGSAPQVPNNAVRLADPDPNQPVDLTVELSPRDPAALQAFVTAVSTPGSPQYKQYLPKGRFAAAFGPTEATVDTVTAALEAQGLEPGAVTEDGLAIPVRTTVGEAARALHVGFAGYRMSDGRTTYTNTDSPELPAGAAAAVTGIVGLNNLVKPVPHHTTTGKTVAVPAGAGSPVHSNVATPAFCASIKQLFADNGLQDTQNYWEPATLAANYAYGTGTLLNQYGNTGAGVTVGLLELENYDPQDIKAFNDCFGLRNAVSTVKVAGGPTLPPSYQTLVGMESALDIEVVAGIAPGAAIKVYQGPDNASSTDYLATYRQMVTDDAVQVISTSWGICETDMQAWDPGLRSAEANVFAMAAAQGQTVVAASGDSGSTGCYQNPSSPDVSNLVTDDPASQPNVLGVGGTRMTLPSGASTVSQSTWNTPGAYPGASGGGVSRYQALSGASNYQSTVQGSGYSNLCGAASGSTCRQVPDVSAVADGDTGYLVANGHDGTPGQPDFVQYWTIVGGTSGAAPLWAAILALTDASQSCAANGAVGFVNPTLYQHSNLLTDVTTGNNKLDGSGYAGTLYPATTGYDLATGLGTPKAPGLVEALCAAKPASVGTAFSAVTPARILDTRSAIGQAGTAPLGAGATLKLQVANANGIPGGVSAVVLNVTATEPTDGGFLTLWPDGSPRPASSNLNFVKGQTIPNQVTVPVGPNGVVDIYNRFGTVHVIADVFGYYSTGGSSRFNPLTPTRVLDTRSATGVPGTAPLGAGATLQLPVTGANGVPTSGVSAVVLNVTATEASDGGFLTLWPDGSSRPASSNLNFVKGQTIPNLVTVPVGPNGIVDIYNRFGTVHVIADLFGYFSTDGGGYLFHTSTPQRVLDTRSGQGVAAGQQVPVGPGGVLALPLQDSAGAAGNYGPLATAKAIMLNVTVTEASDGGFLTVYPSGVARPASSNLNFVAGQTIPNAVVTPVNGSAIDFYNRFGTVQVIADVFGYYASN